MHAAVFFMKKRAQVARVHFYAEIQGGQSIRKSNHLLNHLKNREKEDFETLFLLSSFFFLRAFTCSFISLACGGGIQGGYCFPFRGRLVPFRLWTRGNNYVKLAKSYDQSRVLPTTRVQTMSSVLHLCTNTRPKNFTSLEHYWSLLIGRIWKNVATLCLSGPMLDYSQFNTNPTISWIQSQK